MTTTDAGTVAGYSGVTANGAGYTGAAPDSGAGRPAGSPGYPVTQPAETMTPAVSVPSDEPPAYPVTAELPVETPRPGTYDQVVQGPGTSTEWAAEVDPLPVLPLPSVGMVPTERADGPRMYADNTTEIERWAARVRFAIVSAVAKEYPWFDGSPGAWIFLSAQEKRLNQEQTARLLRQVERTARGMSDAEGRGDYGRIIAPEWRRRTTQRPPGRGSPPRR